MTIIHNYYRFHFGKIFYMFENIESVQILGMRVNMDTDTLQYSNVACWTLHHLVGWFWKLETLSFPEQIPVAMYDDMNHESCAIKYHDETPWIINHQNHHINHYDYGPLIIPTKLLTSINHVYPLIIPHHWPSCTILFIWNPAGTLPGGASSPSASLRWPAVRKAQLFPPGE